MIRSLKLRFIPSLSASVLTAIALVHPAFAATHEQIIEKCKEAVHPQAVACMQSRGGQGTDREANRAACRALLTPTVRACVLREEQRQAVGTPAPPPPKDPVGATAKNNEPVRTAFVAPPRTIADITAILDSEKPDKAKIAERKANADAIPPAGASPAKLAQFYYDRANARSLLGRNKEALADGLQALAVGKGGLHYLLSARIQQLIGLQYKALGDPKQAISAFQAIVRGQGPAGPKILSMAAIAATLVSMGDVSQANTYAGRVEALVQEARGSPHPVWRKFYRDYGNVWEASADSVRALIFEARGQYPEAEAAYRRTEAFARASLNDMPRWEYPAPRELILWNADAHRLSVDHWRRRGS
jgi:hypothetical protein